MHRTKNEVAKPAEVVVTNVVTPAVAEAAVAPAPAPAVAPAEAPAVLPAVAKETPQQLYDRLCAELETERAATEKKAADQAAIIAAEKAATLKKVALILPLAQADIDRMAFLTTEVQKMQDEIAAIQARLSPIFPPAPVVAAEKRTRAVPKEILTGGREVKISQDADGIAVTLRVSTFPEHTLRCADFSNSEKLVEDYAKKVGLKNSVLGDGKPGGRFRGIAHDVNVALKDANVTTATAFVKR